MAERKGPARRWSVQPGVGSGSDAEAAIQAALNDEKELAAMEAAPAGGKSAALQEIEALYGEHNPPKVAEIPSLIAKYGEPELLRMVRKKYNVSNASAQPAAAAAPAAASESAQSPAVSKKPVGARSSRAKRWSVAPTDGSAENMAAAAAAEVEPDGPASLFNRTVGGGISADPQIAAVGPPSPASAAKSRKKAQSLLNSIIDSDEEEEIGAGEQKLIAARGGKARRWSTEGIKEANDVAAAAKEAEEKWEAEQATQVAKQRNPDGTIPIAAICRPIEATDALSASQLRVLKGVDSAAAPAATCTATAAATAAAPLNDALRNEDGTTPKGFFRLSASADKSEDGDGGGGAEQNGADEEEEEEEDEHQETGGGAGGQQRDRVATALPKAAPKPSKNTRKPRRFSVGARRSDEEEKELEDARVRTCSAGIGGKAVSRGLSALA
eukprot:COSAG05_NODE_4180_length_1635_cov_1.715495_2_plen_440_part_01